MHRIAFLTPGDFEQRSSMGGEPSPAQLAGWVVDSSRGSLDITIITYGGLVGQRPLRPGVTLHVLPGANRPADPRDVVSWELPAAIEGMDLVHIFQPFTRSGEMGLLVARQQRKPICVTDAGGQSSTLGRFVNMLDLADLVICWSEHAASSVRQHTRHTPVVVITGGVDADFLTHRIVGARLCQVYERLLPSSARAAA